jgi:hypothetical protein
VLDRQLDDGATEDFASLALGDDAAGRPHWMFNKVPEPKQVKNRVHVDLISPTPDQDVKRLLAIGATHVADFDEDGSRWTTLADPEGNEFDIVAANGDDERNEPASGR